MEVLIKDVHGSPIQQNSEVVVASSFVIPWSFEHYRNDISSIPNHNSIIFLYQLTLDFVCKDKQTPLTEPTTVTISQSDFRKLHDWLIPVSIKHVVFEDH